ncbi:MAG: FAD synthetase family protein [Anaerolineae bacterium]|jgi:FAD synthase|nr:FAD synthetase family protein [Anaerolineae bacterium]
MWDLDHQELPHLPRCWLTIGAFDGVHMGHQKMIRFLVAGAREQRQPAVALTFHPHPQVVLKAIQSPYYLTSPGKRAQLLRALGVDYVFTLPFDENFAQQSAREFIDKIHARLHPSQLVIGQDFALGKDRGGNPETLKALGAEYDFHVTLIDPEMEDGEVVSSSRIRRLVSTGELSRASQLLCRAYAVVGRLTAVEPTHAGWQFLPWEGCLLPPPGDYPVRLAAQAEQAFILSVGKTVHHLRPKARESLFIDTDDEHEIIFIAQHQA